MAHIMAVETLAGQLIDVGVPVSDENIISKIVWNLPLSYRTFQTTWASTNPAEHTRALLTTRLVNEERAIQRYQQAQQSLGDTSSTTDPAKCRLTDLDALTVLSQVIKLMCAKPKNETRELQRDKAKVTELTQHGQREA
jgi:hypothetical protein